MPYYRATPEQAERLVDFILSKMYKHDIVPRCDINKEVVLDRVTEKLALIVQGTDRLIPFAEATWACCHDGTCDNLTATNCTTVSGRFYSGKTCHEVVC